MSASGSNSQGIAFYGNSLQVSNMPCPYCYEILPSRILYQKHMNNYHREAFTFPFNCTMCQKGFFSQTGLRHHLEAHKGKQFVCVVCDARFNHKHHLKRHLEGVHSLKECRCCLKTFPAGVEFNCHVLNCGQNTADKNAWCICTAIAITFYIFHLFLWLRENDVTFLIWHMV